MKNYIDIKNISKTYEIGRKKYNVLHNLSLNIKKGEFVILKGESGSGKTTLLNLIAGIDSISNGSISIDSIDIGNLKGSKLSSWRGTKIGVVFQFFQLIPTLNIVENVMLPMELNKVYKKNERKYNAIELLRKLGIFDLKYKFPDSISGGEKQRVAIARALANNPDLILADEPTGNLDSKNSIEIHKIFNNLVSDGKTIVYVTHEKGINIENSRTIYIKDGKVGEVYDEA